MTTLAKHQASDLPAVTPRPTCVVCGDDGPDVALALHCAGLAALCAQHSAPTPQQLRAELAAIWVRLANEHRVGKVSDDHVFGVLTGLRPDISPHRRWALYDALDTALHVALRIAEDDGAHHDLGMSPQEAQAYVAGRIAEALADLIGESR